MREHGFLDLVRGHGKHVMPPCLWAQFKPGEHHDEVVVFCKGLPHEVTVKLGLQSATFRGRRFGLLWYNEGLEALWQCMEHTDEEIEADKQHWRDLAEAKRKMDEERRLKREAEAKK